MMVNDRDRREECLSTEVVEACPLCRSRAGELVYATCDRQHRLPGEFMLVRCGECGLVRLSPRPTPEHLPRYYPSEEYYSYQLPTEVAAPVGWRHHLAGLRDRIRHTVLASLGYPTPAPGLVAARAAARAALRLSQAGSLPLSRGVSPLPAGRMGAGCRLR